MNRLLNGCCRVLDAISALMLLIMVLMVFGNVVLRYGFNSGITVSEELSRWLFVWMTFMGSIVALRERAHLGTDMLVSRLPRSARLVCFVVAHGLMLWVTWLMFSGSLQQMRINLETDAPVSGLSLSYFYASGFVFAVLTACILVENLLRGLAGRLSDDELIGVQESEDRAPEISEAPR